MLKTESLKNGIPLAIRQKEIDPSVLEHFFNSLRQLTTKNYKTASEETAKNYLNKFISSLNYKVEVNIGCDIGGGIDLAIIDPQTDKVNVIFETKAFQKDDMISEQNINRKSLHEAIRYYFYQRIVEGNIEVKRVIISDFENWYVFDATSFYSQFFKNPAFKTDYIKWRKGQLDGKTVEVFYRDVAEKHLSSQSLTLSCIKFSLQDFDFAKKEYNNLTKSELRSLAQLYHLFSPDFILKEFKESDNNKLNENFYKELLHILGLKQEEKSGKNVLIRTSEGETESLIGNTIFSFKEKISRYENRSAYGASDKEIEFNIGLELCITWVNRILFLKLLEAQLLNYHTQDRRYKFLDYSKEWTFNELNNLFFKVLAKRLEDRDDEIREQFKLVPYLNSSLFTVTPLEKAINDLSGLASNKAMGVFPKTKLHDEFGKPLKGKLNTLNYFLRFLNAYSFATDQGSSQQSNLISASVLGLIFEKINGYEEGAIFTPSQITMMMTRNTLRRLVVKRFNEAFRLNAGDFDELVDDFYHHLKRHQNQKAQLRQQANSLINGLRICDIAVGSGHFLVSALNELITIKSKLGILCLKDNYSETIHQEIDVANDELIIEDLEGVPFKYRPGIESLQKIQESIFWEKKTLIEDCLFGVDINAKSVQICQLRLWIELLKNAFYTKDSGYKQLETLPNIDINIKQGNSLLYRFDLTSNWQELESAQANKDLNIIEGYKKAVIAYKHNEGDKELIRRQIDEFKNNLRTTFSMHDVSNKKHRLVKEYLQACALSSDTLFGEGDNNFLTGKILTILKDAKAKPKKGGVLLNNQDWEKVGLNRDKLKENNLVNSLKKLERVYENEVKEKENSVLYKTAFEWRIEFPELLDKEGNFIGFDAIIANPPYMNVQTVSRTQPRLKTLYEEKYTVASGNYEFANLFIELAQKLAAKNAENTFILPHKFLNTDNGDELRKYLLKNRSIHTMLHFGANRVFKDADTFTCVIQFNHNQSEYISFYRTPYRADWAAEMIKPENYHKISYDQIEKTCQVYQSSEWHLFDTDLEGELFTKLYENAYRLDEIANIFVGLQTSNDLLYVVDVIEERESTFIVKVPLDGRRFEVEKQFFKPLLRGKDIERYGNLRAEKLVFFPYFSRSPDSSATVDELTVTFHELETRYPLTFKYVVDYESKFKARESGKAAKMKNWWAYIYPKAITKFEQLKLSSMEISTIYPNVFLNDKNLYHPTTVYSWVLNRKSPLSYHALLGIANSKFVWWFMKRTADTLKDDARRFQTKYLNPLPIPKNPDPTIVSKLESLVINRLETSSIAKQETIEKEIDAVVYQLYGFSVEQTQIVEDGVAWGWLKVTA